MHAHRVEVLHAAHRDDVARAVPHGLELDFLPAVDVALDQDLGDGGGVQAALCHLEKLLGRIRHAAARAAQRERRTHDDRIADFFGYTERRLHVAGDVRGDGGLADGLHGLLEQLAVLGLVDRVHIGADQPHAHALQEALVVQLHRQGQAGLPAQTRQQAVRTLLLDDAPHGLGGQRLEVDLVGQRAVGHDRGRVRVDQHHVHARLAQHAAGLRPGVVELGRLTDDDRAGADHQHLADVFIARHACSLPSVQKSGQRGNCSRAGPSAPRGGTAR